MMELASPERAEAPRSAATGQPRSRVQDVSGPLLSSRPQRQIHVTIEEPFQGRLSIRWVRKVIVSALAQALPSGQAAQVAVLVTGDDTVRGLNRDYRGVDEVTDVLSFSADHPGHWEGEDDAPQDRLTTAMDARDARGSPRGPLPFVLPPDELPALGEVIISYPQTERQAPGQTQSKGISRDQAVKRELALLLVHGVLHLVGHDHLETGETAEMQAKEQAALAPIFR